VRKSRRARIALNVVAAGVALIIAAPFLWILSTSFKNQPELARHTPDVLPQHPNLTNYRQVLQTADFGHFMLNSAIVACATTAIAIVLAVLGAYALARLNVRGGRFIAVLMLATQMFPGILLLVPMYQTLSRFHLLNSRLGLVIVYVSFVLPFCLWMLWNYFRSLPKELDEAALVDGCTRLGALRRVIIPASLPAIAAVAIFSLILAWDEFLYANTFIQTTSKRTLPIALQSLIGEFSTNWGLLSAGTVLATVPIIVCFAFVQRNLTGVVSGAVKG
jgi:ABC-type glycerol-3-phosphate transport system permease component